MKGVMNIHTFLLGANSARMLCAALALVIDADGGNAYYRWFTPGGG